MTAVPRPRPRSRPRRRIAHVPRHLAGLAITLALVAAACSLPDGDPPGAAVHLGPVDRVARLEAFDSCDDLLADLHREALERVGPFGLEGQDPYLPIEERLLVEDGVAAESVADAAGATGERQSTVSTTNVQESGVDEPDIVKADGERVVVATTDELVVIDLSESRPEVAGRVRLPGGFDHELLVAGDRALVMTRGDAAAQPLDDLTGTDQSTDIVSPTPSMPSTILTEVDLSVPSEPRVANTVTAAGGYVAARMQGAVARVVVSSAPPDLGFVQPSGAGEAARRRATETNRAVVEHSTLDDWLPRWTARAAGDDRVSAGRLGDCDAIHRPGRLTGLGLVSVLTVDLDHGLDEPDPVSVLGAADMVYASPTGLYVTTERRDGTDGVDDTDPTDPGIDPERAPAETVIDIAPPSLDIHTAIHRFAAPASGPVRYEASGEVEGRLLNQFSLSEHDGVLRVATTRGDPWGGADSDSLVTTLEPVGEELVEIGRVGDLGRGEQIFAVRFVGPMGYVVTFRQTDPLYVVDLRDPASPTVTGELKILGYSAYLHPIDETHVLGVGQDADAEGRTRGTQVSLFDVSDPTAPTRTDQVSIPDADSEVEWDHRAFLWWAPTGDAVLPVGRYGAADGTFRNEALVVGVDPPNGSLAERGRIDHGAAAARRSLVVGETLVTLDDSGLVFSSLADLSDRGELPLS